MEALASGSWLIRERVTRVAAISAVFAFGMLVFLWLGGHGTLDPFGKPIGADFTAFWNAGRIADTNAPARAWNQALLNDSIRATHGTEYATAWLYPPVFLLVAAPLARLPYLLALFLWQLGSLVAAGLALNAILKTRRDATIALASPLSALVLANGQNSLVTAASIGAGLLLAERRPLVAGILFGALLYKPQLALIIAPYLLFTRNWRALLAAAAVAASLILSSILIWGVASWSAFFSSVGYGRFYMEQGSVGFFKSASLFSMARLWGADVSIAYAIQALGAVAALLIVWKARAAPELARPAAVCAAIALSTPYLLDYDMAVVGIGGAFLYAEARKTGFNDCERIVLAFIWIVPWISRPAADFALLPLGPIAMIALAWMSLRRVRQGIAIPPFTCSVCPVT